MLHFSKQTKYTGVLSLLCCQLNKTPDNLSNSGLIPHEKWVVDHNPTLIFCEQHMHRKHIHLYITGCIGEDSTERLHREIITQFLGPFHSELKPQIGQMASVSMAVNHKILIEN